MQDEQGKPDLGDQIDGIIDNRFNVSYLLVSLNIKPVLLHQVTRYHENIMWQGVWQALLYGTTLFSPHNSKGYII